LQFVLGQGQSGRSVSTAVKAGGSLIFSLFLSRFLSRGIGFLFSLDIWIHIYSLSDGVFLFGFAFFTLREGLQMRCGYECIVADRLVPRFNNCAWPEIFCRGMPRNPGIRLAFFR
jgi:hypothetical protein